MKNYAMLVFVAFVVAVWIQMGKSEIVNAPVNDHHSLHAMGTRALSTTCTMFSNPTMFRKLPDVCTVQGCGSDADCNQNGEPCLCRSDRTCVPEPDCEDRDCENDDHCKGYVYKDCACDDEEGYCYEDQE